MRKILCVFALAASALLVQAGAASAQNSVILRATLNGGEETPAAVLSGAVATAEVAVDSVNQEIAVQMRVFNLPSGSTASHIHIAPRGVTGPVVIDFPIGRGVTGDFTLNFRLHDGAAFHARPEIGINTFADALQAIVGGVREYSHDDLPWGRNPGTAFNRRSEYSAVSNAVDRVLQRPCATINRWRARTL